MNNVTCPLCNAMSVDLIETISTHEIEYQYKKNFAVSTNFYAEKVHYFACNECNLGFFNPMSTGSELFYEQLQKFDWYYMSNKAEFDLAKKYLPSIGSILEVGAGKAAFSNAIGKNRYVGLEFNDEAIARARADEVILIKESIEVHAINNKKKYKAVVSFQVLEHVPMPSLFIQGCVDSLQDGGYLIIAVPNHDGLCGLAQNHLLDMPPHHVTHWSELTLKRIASLFDLELVGIECETVSNYHLVWARQMVWEKRLRNFFWIRPCLLDTSYAALFLSKVASFIAKVFPPSVDKMKGHAVVAVYRRH
jgi:2-polyprenyl-3-methyl-5-hydroxy-6-metoxy-1,4-benzoquinol methylase